MIESQHRPSATESGSQHFAIFAFLWAIALLYHQIYYRDAFRSIFDVALTGSALNVLLSPSSAWSLLAATGFHVLAVIYHLPDVFNHWFFAGLVSLAFVLIATTVLIRDQHLEVDTLFPSFALVAQLNLIFLYYFGAFHKLNADYFSLDVSCGPVTYSQLLEVIPLLPASDTALWAATYLGVIMELALPALLISRRWRRSGVVLGFLFHLCLGLMGYSRFSAVSFSLLTLFLPDLHPTVNKVILRLDRNAPLQTTLTWLRERKWLLLGAIFVIGVILPNTIGDTRAFADKVGDFSARTGPFLFLAESAVLIAVAMGVLRRYRFAKAPPFSLLPPVRSGLLATALVALSGFAPYLGLHTLNTFAMYSNVRTEGGSTNHFVVPAGFQPFSYQRDLVEIIETNIGPLQKVADDQMLLPYQQLRVEITKEMKQGRKGISVVFFRNGETISTANAEDHPQLGKPVNIVAFKFFTFRAVEKSGGRTCTY